MESSTTLHLSKISQIQPPTSRRWGTGLVFPLAQPWGTHLSPRGVGVWAAVAQRFPEGGLGLRSNPRAGGKEAREEEVEELGPGLRETSGREGDLLVP